MRKRFLYLQLTNIVFLSAVVAAWTTSTPTSSSASFLPTSSSASKIPNRFPLFQQPDGDKVDGSTSNHASQDCLQELSVSKALQQRYACTRFQRFDSVMESTTDASPSNATVVELALQALQESQRAPSGFNVQPYKLLAISDPQQKKALASWCCGKNAHRVRDSDVTVLFLADRQSMRELPRYRKYILTANAASRKRTMSTNALVKIQVLVSLFSQGIPYLPYWMSAFGTWWLRLGMRITSWITRQRLPIPTLSSSDTWAQKNTMLTAMSYLLACTSHQLATCPMEGYCAWGIRSALKIPRRYAIPLIVATGSPYQRPTTETDRSDDAGMEHGPKQMTVRYPTEQTIYHNAFGAAVSK